MVFLKLFVDFVMSSMHYVGFLADVTHRVSPEVSPPLITASR